MAGNGIIFPDNADWSDIRCTGGDLLVPLKDERGQVIEYVAIGACPHCRKKEKSSE